MKIAVFTSNQPRHLHLIKSLANIATEVYAISEVTTLFPGATEDFYKKSDVMKVYFEKMQQAERDVFGHADFLPINVRLLPLKMGDINSVPMEWLKKLEDVDYCVVFGASWIKGELVELLLRKKAINIHMGVSPFFRGATCNFWAMYEKKPEFVGATIHYLSKGLDSGKIIMHTFPKPREVDGFTLGMLSVKSAQEGLCNLLKSKEVFKLESQVQDKSLEIRYSKRVEFNDEVAQDYLNNMMSTKEIFKACEARDLSIFLRPFLV